MWGSFQRENWIRQKEPRGRRGGGRGGGQRADLEIVGQPVSLADRKFLTSQKVLMGQAFCSNSYSGGL